MNKRYIIITALIIMVLTGCSKSSYIIKNGSIEKEKNKISGFYDYFNGYKEYYINLDKGEHEVTIETNSDDGNLSILINEEKVFNSKESDIKLQKLEVKNKKNKIRVEGDNHQGDFIITWIKSE